MGEVILEVRNVSKTFPGVNALKHVNLTVHKGEAMALVGENGAGKSTLMKVLSGIYKRDEGEIIYQGKSVEFANSRQAAQAGLSIIHQELNLVPQMTIYENVFLGRELRKNGRIDKKAMIDATRKLLKQINVELDPARQVKGLSIAMQQMVEIAKALSLDANVIIMDEPTGALPDDEVASLFKIISELKRQGKAIIYISHRLKEVFEICERATVFRDGELIGEKPVSELDTDTLVNMMVGRRLDEQFPYVPPLENTQTVLELEKLTNQFVSDVSLKLKGGSIVGIAGLAGAGRTELAKTICGVYPYKSGVIKLKGQVIHPDSPAKAIKNGIYYVSEDRKAEGLILAGDVKSNITLSSLQKITKMSIVNVKQEMQICEGYRKSLRIQTPGLLQKTKFLSGGNQQKVVLAKALMSEPEILILDEPTRGIDVGAKKEIYTLANEMKRQGKAILMISSEMPELLGVCDRILVMHEGRLKGEFDRSEATQEKLMAAMVSEDK